MPWRGLPRAVVGMVALAALAAAPSPGRAQNPRAVREFVAEAQGILADVEVVRRHYATALENAGQAPPPEDPAKAAERFRQEFGGVLDRFRGRVRKLVETRQRAERTLSRREADFTAEIHGDLLRLMQRVAGIQAVGGEPPARRAAHFEEMEKQAEALRRKLQAYPEP